MVRRPPHNDRVRCRGCEAELILASVVPDETAFCAQQFALAIHELTTNALKYVVLSTPAGRISIECDIKRTNGDGTFSFW